MRTALVTGASRGIGRSIALRLASQGYGLTICSRTTADLERLAAELRSVGAPSVTYVEADLSDRQQSSDVVLRHVETFASMDALILNAGIGTTGPIGEFPLRRLDKTLEINLVSAFIVLQASLPLLRRTAADSTRGAKVVAISSLTGVYSEPGMAMYGASKAALISMVETLNHEEVRSGVRATAVAPGYVETDMTAFVTDRIPGDTMITADDVVEVVDMVLRLSPNTVVPRVLMTRADSGGYRA